MPPGAYCADVPTPSFHYLSFSDRQVPTWFRWRRSGRKAESESGGDGLLANPRSRPTPLSAFRTPTSESVGWLLLLFAIEKQRKKFFMYFWGQKYQKPPHVVFRGSARAARCTGRARSGLCATPWRTRRSSHPLFPRQTRVRICCAAVGGKGYDKNKYVSATCAFFYPARRFPTWFRWRESGRRAESESGGDGLLANPRSRPTPLSAFRTRTSESVGWLLLLFDTEKQLKKFFMYFWGQKYQKPPHVVFRGSARAAALHGARKIRPMRHPVADAPQLAPSFSASNESADLLCRQRRHFLFYLAMHPGILFPQGGSRLGSDGGKAAGGLKARAAGTVCLQTRAVARRRFQPSGRRHRNRSGGFCCFSPSKSR